MADYPEIEGAGLQNVDNLRSKSATWSACRWPAIRDRGRAVAAVRIYIVEMPRLAYGLRRLARDKLGDHPALRIGKAKTHC